MNKEDNPILKLTFEFSIQVVLYCELLEEKRKYVIANQLLKSGTSIGANCREAQNAESKADFIHKNAIAQKEANETIYWLELLYSTNYISKELFDELNFKAVELIKMLTSIIKTAKGLN